MSIIGLGFDATDIPRVRDVLERYGQRFLERVFTDEEIEYCTRRRDPAPHLAGRFAAKEAVLKALGTGYAQGLGFREVEVLRHDTGAPRLVLHGAAKERAIELGITKILVSITHTRANAHAVAVAD